MARAGDFIDRESAHWLGALGVRYGCPAYKEIWID